MPVFKAVLYWLSVILPMVDAFRGACEGIRTGLRDMHKHPQDGKTLEELEDKGEEQ